MATQYKFWDLDPSGFLDEGLAPPSKGPQLGRSVETMTRMLDDGQVAPALPVGFAINLLDAGGRPGDGPAPTVIESDPPLAIAPENGGAETRVNTETVGRQADPSITALADGGYVVTWVSEDQDGSGDSVHLQRFDVTGSPVGVETQVNTFSAGDQNDVSVGALADGGFVVAWRSVGQDGSFDGVYAQRYTAAGAPDGAEFRVNTTTSNDQEQPAVSALVDGGFVVSWVSNLQDGSLGGVYAQLYTAAGAPDGGEFRVNTTTLGNQFDPSVTALVGGGFVVTWTSAGQDGSDDGVFAQRYTAAGDPDGAEFQVNTYISADQDNVAMASLADGGFVIAWESSGQDGSDAGVYMQRYDASGVAQGVETRVNSVTAGFQGNPSVTGLVGGGFVVAWTSDGQDGSGPGIYVQEYDAQGAAVDGEVLVNVFTDGDQEDPQVTALAGGGFVVTWESFAQDGDGDGIYSRAFNVPTEGDDVLTGTPDDDILDGLGGNDQISGLGGDDELIGGAGDDTLEGGGGADDLIGGDGVDDASYRMATSQVRLDLNSPQFCFGEADGDTFDGIERFQLTDFGDTFVVSLGLDAVVFGHDGFDIFFANGGDDLFDGGGGKDFVRYDAAAGPVTIDLEVAEAQNTGGDGVDTLVSIEDVGGGAGSDVLRGTADANRLFGQGGDDTLEGRGGDDVLRGDRGRDTLTGGDGNDEFFFFNFQNGDVVAGEVYDGGEGTDRLTFEKSADFSVATLMSIERLVFRGAADATFAGNQIGGGALSSTLVVEGSSGSANALTVNLATPGSVDLSDFTFVAWDADDTITLNGSSGADSIRGSSQADRMTGGLGDDTYYVDNLGDVVTEARGEGNDRVVSSVSFNAQTMGAEVETIILTGAARTAIGDVFDNRLVGNASQNILNGYKGADQMEGRGGDDIYVVDNVGDVVVETEGNGTDRVNSAIDYTLGDHVENLTLLGGGDISGTGNDLLNRVVGNRGDNVIAGSGGVDILSGGVGNDTFVYTAVSDSTYGGYDRIMDLDDNDTIDLTLVDANANVGGDQDFVLVDSFSRTAGEMILDDSRAGLTFLVGDTDGDGRGDFRIALIGDHGDFDNILG